MFSFNKNDEVYFNFMSFEITPVGIAHTSFKDLKEVPRCSKDQMAEGYIEIYKDYEDCLLGLDEFKQIFAFSWMHMSDRNLQQVKPHRRKDLPALGVFATRSPVRPNPIGLTLLEVTKIDGRNVYVKGMDLLDGTPIIDIKKYDACLDTPESD